MAYCVWVPSTASLDPGLKNRDRATRTKKGHGRPTDGKALEVRAKMEAAGVRPTAGTFALIQACGNVGDLGKRSGSSPRWRPPGSRQTNVVV